MNIIFGDGPLLDQITIERAESYLLSHGWKVFRVEKRYTLWTLKSGGSYAPVPKAGSDDYTEDMASLLETLKAVESRPPLAILAELIDPNEIRRAVDLDIGVGTPEAADPADLADLAAIRRLRQLKAAGTISDWGIENDGDDGFACVFAAPKRGGDFDLRAGNGPTIAAAVADALKERNGK